MILGRFRMRGCHPDLAAGREAMVKRDLRARGIRDPRVLEAMRAVPREAFVPPEVRDEAYADRALPIGHGQTISQPYIVALMVEALALRGRETVLEVGVGSGYAAAVLAELANWVVGIERVPELAAAAGERLGLLDIQNVEVHAGDGSRGWAKDAPYDGILVSAAAPAVPPGLAEQLAEGGRLVIPLGEDGGTQILTLIRRRGRSFDRRDLCACKFVPLVPGTEAMGEAGAEEAGGREARPEAGPPEPPGDGPGTP